MKTFKRKLRERFLRYDSWLYPVYFWKRFPLYKIPALMLQRLIIYTFLGRENKVLSVRFPGLKNLRVCSYHSLLGGLRYFGWWETELWGVLRTYLPRVKSFVEIGAMEGFYEVIARKLNPECRIVAVEPETGAYERIAENFRLNSLALDERFVFFRQFVEDVSSEKTITIEKLLAGLPQPIFLLMDIDGGEEKALKGGMEALMNAQMYVVIETHSPHLEESCMRMLQECGYTVSLITNAWWRHVWPEERPAPQHGVSHNRWFFATNIV